MTTQELNTALRGSIALEDEKQGLVPVRPASVQLSPRDLIEQAFAKCESAADLERVAGVVEKLVALEQTAERFAWEREERQLKSDFDDALSTCQKTIERVKPNQKRLDTHSSWADYAQLDRAIRPIYTAEGFAIAYSEVEPIHAGKVRIKATLSRKGISKDYFQEITPSTTGAKGNALVNATDADAIAQSRAKRYLLIDIFNIAVGIDADEKKGIAPAELMPESVIDEYLDALKASPDRASLQSVFSDCWTKAKKIGDSAAKQAFEKAYEARKREL